MMKTGADITGRVSYNDGTGILLLTSLNQNPKTLNLPDLCTFSNIFNELSSLGPFSLGLARVQDVQVQGLRGF